MSKARSWLYSPRDRKPLATTSKRLRNGCICVSVCIIVINSRTASLGSEPAHRISCGFLLRPFRSRCRSKSIHYSICVDLSEAFAWIEDPSRSLDIFGPPCLRTTSRPDRVILRYRPLFLEQEQGRASLTGPPRHLRFSRIT